MIFLGSSISSNIEFEDRIEIQTSISEKGLPTFEIYGLINKSIEESKKRITSAFESIGISFPLKNVSINLAPSEIRKEGTHYDLAIAATILKFTNSINYNPNTDLFFGELSLNGSIKGIKNILYLVILSKQLGFKRIYVPRENLRELGFIKDIELYAIDSLRDLLDFDNILKQNNSNLENIVESLPINFGKIIGNTRNKQILSYCLSGKHPLLLNGYPGTGKSLLAKSASELAPDLNQEQALEVSKIFSYSNLERNISEFYRPPFRSPHNSSSYSAIFGSSGYSISPGEVALSNHGVLFLDEFPEFNRLVIEGLRSPLEDRYIILSRAKNKKKFATDFILLAAMNPCKCGYFNHSKISCKCLPSDIKRYQNKISGPILDRMDIVLNFSESNNLKIGDEQQDYSYNEYLKLKSKIKDTRGYIESFLLAKSTNDLSNLLNNEFIQHNFSSKAVLLVNSLQNLYSISNRKLFRILKLAFTVAVYNQKNTVDEDSVLESLALSKS